MKGHPNAQAAIQLRNGVDLTLGVDGYIVVITRDPKTDALLSSIILCEATDHEIELFKGYLDTLLTVAP